MFRQPDPGFRSPAMLRETPERCNAARTRLAGNGASTGKTRKSICIDMSSRRHEGTPVCRAGDGWQYVADAFKIGDSDDLPAGQISDGISPDRMPPVPVRPLSMTRHAMRQRGEVDSMPVHAMMRWQQRLPVDGALIPASLPSRWIWAQYCCAQIDDTAPPPRLQKVGTRRVLRQRFPALRCRFHATRNPRARAVVPDAEGRPGLRLPHLSRHLRIANRPDTGLRLPEYFGSFASWRRSGR